MTFNSGGLFSLITVADILTLINYILLLSITIGAFVSYKMACIAKEKGYSKGAYFCVAFFLGIPGFIWICALRDLKQEEKLNKVLAMLEEEYNHPKAETP